MLALCTNKEIIELDIKNLISKDSHIDDECEMDILALQKYDLNFFYFCLIYRTQNILFLYA